MRELGVVELQEIQCDWDKVSWKNRQEPGREGFISHTKSLGFILKVVCRGVIYMLFRNIPVSAF